MSNNFFNFPEFDNWDDYPMTRMSFLMLVYCLPPFMISSKLIGFEYRNEVAILFAIFLMAYAYIRGFSTKELGFRLDNIYEALQAFLPAMFVVLVFLCSIYFSGMVHIGKCSLSYHFIFFYFFISSPFQEFCYRSLLIAELNKGNYFSERSKIILSTIMFSMLHIMYFHYLLLFLSVGMGLMWAYLYQKTPNLVAASLAHFVVGIMAFWLGLGC